MIGAARKGGHSTASPQPVECLRLGCHDSGGLTASDGLCAECAHEQDRGRKFSISAEEVALNVARRFKRKCWWAPFDDLAQVARMACHTARRTFDPNRGTPFAGYAYRAASRAVWSHVMRESSPVSASDHYLGDLRGLARADVSVLDDTPQQQPSVLENLVHAEWRARVKERLVTLLEEALGKNDASMVLRVVLEQEHPSKVAADNGVATAQIYKHRRRATLLVLRDAQCYRLWQEKT